MPEKTYTINELRELLTAFIEEEYPKGDSPERGAATVSIVAFTCWLLKEQHGSSTPK